MKNIRLFIQGIIALFFISLLFTLSPSVADDLTSSHSSITGLWYNHSPQGCSTMNVIDSADTGAFTGQYSNGQSGWCAKPGDWFPLTGALTSENAITFTVNWKNNSTDCHSTTVWTGNKKDKFIKTKWVLTSSTGDPVTGSDTFIRDCQCSRCPEPEVESKTNN